MCVCVCEGGNAYTCTHDIITWFIDRGMKLGSSGENPDIKQKQ